MMKAPKNQRAGTTTVEMAFVAVVALLFLFGIIEYARYVHMLQVTHNAAREGARLAVVSTGNGSTATDIENEVRRRMAGREKELQNFQVQILNVNPDTGQEITGVPWTDSGFGDAIAVRITGTYRPILPSFLMTSEMVNVDIKHMMSSEAN